LKKQKPGGGASEAERASAGCCLYQACSATLQVEQKKSFLCLHFFGELLFVVLIVGVI
jgi:hypothetical protein